MADIILTGNTSGTITVAAPAVAGTNTLTLPASTGTLATTATQGKILQVQQGALTTSVSTTSTSYTDLITVSLTPSSTSSKIYVSFTTNAGTGGDVNHLYTALFRDSTEIGSATSTDSRTGAQTVTNTATQQQFTYAGAKLDSPSTTSTVTYAVKVKVSTGTGYWNRSARDSNNSSYDGRSVSQITAMEVGA